MNAVKRISAILLTVVMLFSLSLVAFADDESAATGSVVLNQTDSTGGEKVSIKKELVFVNAETTTVREPNLVYTYTLTAATGVAATVKDSAGLSATVKDGVSAAIADGTDTITFKDTVTATATSAGTADVKYADFEFDESVFAAPGIYRYLITETVSPTKASVGVSESGTYNNVRYLDVYVKKTDASLPSAAGNMEIYGYVLYEGANEDVSFNGYTGETANLDKKSAGFVSGSQGYDVYETENLYVSKSTSGVLGDKGQDFPVSIALAAPSGVTAPKLDVAVSGSGVLNSTLSDTVGSYLVLGTLTGTVRDGSVLTIKGVPVGSTFTLTETNASPDSYSVTMTSSVDGGAASTVYTTAIVAASGTATSSSVTVSGKVEFEIANVLDAISPTGYAERFLPFAILLVLGAAMIAVTVYVHKANDKRKLFLK